MCIKHFVGSATGVAKFQKSALYKLENMGVGKVQNYDAIGP